jgi:hypothetical protein
MLHDRILGVVTLPIDMQADELLAWLEDESKPAPALKSTCGGSGDGAAPGTGGGDSTVPVKAPRTAFQATLSNEERDRIMQQVRNQRLPRSTQPVATSPSAEGSPATDVEIRWASANELASAARLAVARGELPLAVKTYNDAIAALQSHDDMSAATLWRELAAVLISGDLASSAAPSSHRDALAAATRAVTILEEGHADASRINEAKATQAEALLYCAFTAARLGRPEEAINWLRQGSQVTAAHATGMENTAAERALQIARSIATHALARHADMTNSDSTAAWLASTSESVGVQRVKVVEDQLVGRRLVTTTSIDVGDVVLCEKAVLSFSPVEGGQSVARDAGVRDLNERATALLACLHSYCAVPKESQTAILQHFRVPDDQIRATVKSSDVQAAVETLQLTQTTRHHAADKMTVDIATRLAAITDNNALSAGPDYGVAALGLTASMAEHNCDPNCHFVVIPAADNNEASRAVVYIAFIARRAIATSEAVSIAYVDVSKPRQVRRAALATRYCFRCECPMCRPGALEPSRAFECEHCGEGVALPRISEHNDETPSVAAVATEWRCCPTFTFGTAARVAVPCGRPQSAAVCERYSAIERHAPYGLGHPAALVDVDALLHSGAARGHHLVLRAAFAQALRSQAPPLPRSSPNAMLAVRHRQPLTPQISPFGCCPTAFRAWRSWPAAPRVWAIGPIAAS